MRTRSTFLLPILTVLVLLLPSGAVLSAPPKIGQPAPDFTLRSSEGKNLKLSERRGEVIMVNFWATWCAPCRQEMPQLNVLHDRYRRNGFTLLAVNVDDNEKAAQDMIRQLGIRFPVLFDTRKQASRQYDVDAMPSTLLIDRDGRVRYLHRGYRAGVEKEYEEKIRELLKE